MPLTLPEPITDRLGNSPLKLVVCQVRFEESPSVSESRVGWAVFGSLGGASGAYPLFSEFRGQQVDITMAPGSPIAAQQTQLAGWRFMSEDRNWTVVLLPSSVSLETKAYSTWSDDFAIRLKAILEAVVEHIAPALQMRLGLRYIDEIRIPDTVPVNETWADWVDGSLLGPAPMGSRLGLLAAEWQGLVRFDAGPGRSIVLRYGPREGYAVDPGGDLKRPTADSGPFFLLDIDSFWTPTGEIPEFDSGRILAVVDELHAPVSQLFESLITERLRSEVLRNED